MLNSRRGGNTSHGMRQELHWVLLQEQELVFPVPVVLKRMHPKDFDYLVDDGTLGSVITVPSNNSAVIFYANKKGHATGIDEKV